MTSLPLRATLLGLPDPNAAAQAGFERTPPGASGFTLVEVIVTLVLMGILAALAGTGLVAGVKGYALARDATREAQAVQVAMARLSRELMELMEVDAGAYPLPNPSAIRYARLDGFRLLGFDDGRIKLAQPGVPLAQGDMLLGDVSGATFGFFKEYGGESSKVAWDGSEIRELALITVQVDLAAKGSGMPAQTYRTAIHLRNNRNRGGE
jgi:prepilin-type N-terminal cleavage/methylation domain-containing protein